MVRSSVALAVYNGEKYIREQLESIISMMSEQDEVIISYEASIDNTLSIIQEYSDKDARIRIVYDNGNSVESNFNNAVKNCRGKYIFLADQDDVWINDKINVMTKYFEKNEKCVVLICNGYQSTESLEDKGELFETLGTTSCAVKNFIKGTYLGCQMAFRASICNYVWPVREKPPLPHDLWLGVMGSRYGDVELLDLKLIRHRMHDNNFSRSSKMNTIGVLKNRLLFLSELCRRGKRCVHLNILGRK